MLALALLVIAICLVVLIKAYGAQDEEPTYVFVEEDEDWLWPDRWRDTSRTEER